MSKPQDIELLNDIADSLKSINKSLKNLERSSNEQTLLLLAMGRMDLRAILDSDMLIDELWDKLSDKFQCLLGNLYMEYRTRLSSETH